MSPGESRAAGGAPPLQLGRVVEHDVGRGGTGARGEAADAAERAVLDAGVVPAAAQARHVAGAAAQVPQGGRPARPHLGLRGEGERKTRRGKRKEEV